MKFWQRFTIGLREPNSLHSPEKLPLATSATVPGLDEIGLAIKCGDFDKALAQIDFATRHGPIDPALFVLQAQAYRLGGRYEEALTACEVALGHAILPSPVHVEVANCQIALGDVDGAIDALNVALELDQRNGAAWLMLGKVHVRLDNLQTAAEDFERSVLCTDNDADRADAWHSLGQTRLSRLDIKGAKTAFQECLTIDPGFLPAKMGLGLATLWLDDEPLAVTILEEVLQATATPSRTLLVNLAYALQHCARFDEARGIYTRLISQDANDYTSRWYLSQMELLLGNWSSGWRDFNSRFDAGAAQYRPIGYKPWDGGRLPGETLLVLADEGIGDEIMYASCLAEARDSVGELIVECEPRLTRLFERSFPNMHFVPTRRDNNPGWLAGLPLPTRQIPAGGLPAIFRLNEADFPAHTGYLKADPILVSAWHGRLEKDLGPGLRVGVSWRGGTVRTRQQARTMSPIDWGPILSVPGVHFVNLQYGNYVDELSNINHLHGIQVRDYPEAIADFDETAALVASLDLVVSVCTTIVHLAGALGKPVWILAPLVPGWRYTTGDAMPWYPSSRMFRQLRWGDWQSASKKLSCELAELTRSVTSRAG